MPLFLPRVLQKKLKDLTDVPTAHRDILDAWARNLAAGIYDSETQSDSEFIQRILIDVLGYPIVAKADFNAKLGATYRRRAASPKVVLKGLTLLDGAVDLDGSFVPGKSTIVINSDDPVTLKFVAGISG